MSNLVMAFAAVYAAKAWVKQLVKAQFFKVIGEVHELMYQLSTKLGVLEITSNVTSNAMMMPKNVYDYFENNRHATYKNALGEIRNLYYTNYAALTFKYHQVSNIEAQAELKGWMDLFLQTLSAVELNYSSKTNPNVKDDIEKLKADAAVFYSKYMG